MLNNDKWLERNALFIEMSCDINAFFPFFVKTGKLLHRLSVETSNKMFICSALYKDRVSVPPPGENFIGGSACLMLACEYNVTFVFVPLPHDVLVADSDS